MDVQFLQRVVRAARRDVKPVVGRETQQFHPPAEAAYEGQHRTHFPPKLGGLGRRDIVTIHPDRTYPPADDERNAFPVASIAFEQTVVFWQNAVSRHPGGNDSPIMLLLTYSYVVPKDKRTEHARLLLRMRQTMARLGCEHFEAYEQVGKSWIGGEPTGRVVQILKFRDRQAFAAVQAAEKTDPQAQQLIKEFCDLINLPYQQQANLFMDGYYSSLIATAATRAPGAGDPPPIADASPDDAPPGFRSIDPLGGQPATAGSNGEPERTDFDADQARPEGQQQNL